MTELVNIIAPNQRIATQWAHNRGLSRADLNYISSVHGALALPQGAEVTVVAAGQDHLIQERADAAKERGCVLTFV